MFATIYTKKEPLTFIAETAGSTIKLTRNGKDTTTANPHIQYRTDEKSDWEDYTIGNTITLTNVDDYVQFKNLDTYLGGPNISNLYFQFVMTGLVWGRGNIQSLLNYSDSVLQGSFARLFQNCTSLLSTPKMPASTLIGQGQYYYMYYGCSNLIESEDLPAKTINKRSYYDMYFGCISLRKTPKIAAVTVDQYSMCNMFRECSGLVFAEELKATNSDICSYWSMFDRCTSLEYAPKMKCLTNVAPSSHQQMFYGCEKLKSAPEFLSAITDSADYCYEKMFSFCSALTDIPTILPATTLSSSCYQHMFEGCTSITYMPELPAIILSDLCYTAMFKSCYSLTDMKELPATGLTVDCYYSMFGYNYSLTGVVDILPATSATQYCYAQMFYECNSLTTTPKIKLQNFDVGSCERMFYNCTGLVDAPELLPTSLTPNTPYEDGIEVYGVIRGCLEEMYMGCTNLSSITVHFEEWEPSGTIHWVTNVQTNNGIFNCPSTLPEVYGNNNIPTNWTRNYI